ncbi:MAG: two-component regulator propeller domain-containing protein [Reichenbachiella sp.]|uniref:two-component regulator propeller domain-containing protein n=1 Tax=Reichenbachiella sp. TaxID=2184521 RepID=UPI0032664817
MMQNSNQKIIVILATLVLLLSMHNSFGKRNENTKFGRLTIDNGLSQNSVTAILQDSKCFLWIATPYALNRYDGYDFKAYEIESFITSIEEDRNGNILIGTYDGLMKLNPQLDEITSIRNDIDTASIKINALYKTTKGNVLIGHTKGVSIIMLSTVDSMESERIGETFVELKTLSGKNVKAIHQDHQGQIWFGTANDGLICMTSISDNLYSKQFYQNAAAPYKIHSNAINSITTDHQGLLWIATDNGLVRLNKSQSVQCIYNHNSDDRLSIAANSISDVFYSEKSGLWIGTRTNGVARFDFDTNNFHNIKSNYHDQRSLSDNNVRKGIYEDNTGVVWIGTNHGGVNYYKPDRFQHYFGNTEYPEFFMKNNVQSLYKGKDGIWVTTVNSGLHYFENKSSRIRQIGSGINKLNAIELKSVIEDSKGSIWVVTRNQGLIRISSPLGTPKYHYYSHDKENDRSLSNDEILEVFEDNLGEIWVTHRSGLLSKYLGDTNGFEKHIQLKPTNDEVDISATYLDDNNHVWIGTKTNLVYYDLIKNQVVNEVSLHTIHDSGNSDSLIRSIYGSKDSMYLWIGTNNGLWKFNKLSKEFKQYNIADGLPSNLINAAIQIDESNVWLSTNNGLSHFDLEKEKFINFDNSDGLQGKQFNNDAHHLSNDGQVLFGGLNGFNGFYPGDIKLESNLPSIILTSFKLFDREVKVGDKNGDESPLVKTISYTNSLTIPWDKSVLSFEFSALNFTAPQKVKYEYQLIGFDEKPNLIEGTGSRNISYTNLSPGDYDLRFKAGIDGIWSVENALKLTIIPPIYMTNWFKSIGMTSLIILMAFSFRWRTSTIRKQNRKFEAMVKQRTLELSESTENLEWVQKVVQQQNEKLNKLNSDLELDVSLRTAELEEAINELDGYIDKTTHDLRGPVSAILGIQEVIVNEVKDKAALYYFEIINQQTQKIDNLIIDILTLSHIRHKDLENRSLDLGKILDQSVQILEEEISSAKIDLHINIASNQLIRTDEKILLGLLVNLIKSSINGRRDMGRHYIFIEVSRVQNLISIELIDNGIGFRREFLDRVYDMFFRGDNPRQSSGLGMHIVKTAVNRLRGEIGLKSELNIGSVFKISLPSATPSQYANEYSENYKLSYKS